MIDYFQTQVHCSKDGYDIQTSLHEYQNHYKRIGWELVDRAPVLPGLIQESCVVDNVIQEFKVRQGNLF